MTGWRIRKEHGINFAEAGSGPLIVLCHGGAGSHTHWTRNIDALSAHFRVRALDLPGYGESDPTDKSYTARQYVDAAVPKVDALTNDVDASSRGFLLRWCTFRRDRRRSATG